MTVDLDAMVERAEKWRDLTPLAQETFAEGFADDLTADVLALAEELRRLREAIRVAHPHVNYISGCPVCVALSREPAEKEPK